VSDTAHDESVALPKAGSSEKPIAVVTGASRGIGRAAAVVQARSGRHVIAIARSTKALEKLDDEIRDSGGSCSLVPMDLKDFDGIDRLGLELYQRYGRVDVLIHAAGVLGPLTPTSHVSPRTWDEVMGANLTASFRLIRSLEPLLRLSSFPRAVFFSSGAAANPRAFWGPYAAAKAGTEALIKSWAQEVGFTGLRANLLNPGAVRTKMRAGAFPGEDPMTLPPPEALGSILLEMTHPDFETNGKVINFRDTEHFHAWSATK